MSLSLRDLVTGPLSEGSGSLYLIEARKRDSGREWQPVHVSSIVKYHYSALQSALDALEGLRSSDQSAAHLAFRAATGKRMLYEELEFRIVEVRAIREDQGKA